MSSTAKVFVASEPSVFDGVAPEEIARVATRAWRQIAELWYLDNATAAGLVGVSPRTWGRIKAGSWSGRLSQDQLLRISALVGLYKGLHLYFGPSLADRWPGLPNTGPTFTGRTPLRIMLDGGLPAILGVRDHVDALRGGA